MVSEAEETMDHPGIDASASRVEQKQQRVPKPKDLGESAQRLKISPGNLFGLKTEMNHFLENLEKTGSVSDLRL